MFIYVYLKIQGNPKTRMAWNEYLDHSIKPSAKKTNASKLLDLRDLHDLLNLGNHRDVHLTCYGQGMPWDAMGCHGMTLEMPQSRLLLDRDGDHFVHILNLRNLYNLLHFRHHGHVHLFAGVTGVPSLSI